MSEEDPKVKSEAGSSDDFDRRRRFWIGYGMILLLLYVFAASLLPSIWHFKVARARGEVFLYTSQDQVYAEPILKDFEHQTGIKVRAVFDSESVKPVGLVNRLMSEKDRPQCDIFWNNEELRTRQLAAIRVFDKWAAVGHRSRRIAVNTNRVSLAAAP